MIRETLIVRDNRFMRHIACRLERSVSQRSYEVKCEPYKDRWQHTFRYSEPLIRWRELCKEEML